MYFEAKPKKTTTLILRFAIKHKQIPLENPFYIESSIVHNYLSVQMWKITRAYKISHTSPLFRHASGPNIVQQVKDYAPNLGTQKKC